MSDPLGCLDEAVRRIVESLHPLRIILFGSAARGDAHEDSDLDLLVIMPDGAHRRQTAYAAHESLFDLGCAKDIVVVLESDVELLRDNPSLVIHTAFNEGREVYRAA
jgi:predicted nucleotidyltransferase